MTLKGALVFSIAGVSLAVMSFAVLMGHLPHNWNGIVGQITGWIEVFIAPICSPYLAYRAWREIDESAV